MQSKEEVLEAAMLARMVGSHLSGIDSMTTEKTTNTANKISMQNFVAPLLGQNTQRRIEHAPPEIMKAYEGLNELALRSIPDVPNEANIQNQQIPTNQIIHQIPQQPLKQNLQKNKQETIGTFTRGDIDSIRNSLKNIDKTLSSMLLFLTKKEVKNK